MHLGTATVVRANARTLPIADDTVDLVVTSPPYFALRSYQDAGEHYDGQLGDEPTPTEFVDALLEVTAECRRVLKRSGSLWVNLGDKYATYAGNRSSGRSSLQGSTDRARPKVPRNHGLDGGGEVASKSLMGIPWRYANRVVDELGLILRAEVVWSKPNGLPESVVDRVRRSHETWFHFTLEPRYYSAVDEIRERYAPGTAARYAAGYSDREKYDRAQLTKSYDHADGGPDSLNPLGKLPGSVWTIPTEPLTVPEWLGVDHFAAFPTEWPRRIIQGWSPVGVCLSCGQGRRPVTAVDRVVRSLKRDEKTGSGANGQAPQGGYRGDVSRTLAGYVCDCTPYVDHPGTDPRIPPAISPWREYLFDQWTPADTRPGVVLDPFGGTGTTAMVAKALGRTGIAVDLSADYCRVARWRTNDRDQLAKVLGVAKAPPVDPYAETLF